MSIDETGPTPDDADEVKTDLPGKVTWPAVYLLVVGVTILYIALLVALQKAFT